MRSARKRHKRCLSVICSTNFRTSKIAGLWSTIRFRLILSLLKMSMVSLYFSWSSNFLMMWSVSARGWTTSRFPLGICKTVWVCSGTEMTRREPLSTLRTDSAFQKVAGFTASSKVDLVSGRAFNVWLRVVASKKLEWTKNELKSKITNVSGEGTNQVQLRRDDCFDEKLTRKTNSWKRYGLFDCLALTRELQVAPLVPY